MHSSMQCKVPILSCCHLTWLLNKAWAAVSANALKKQAQLSIILLNCYDSVTQTPMTERRQISESHLSPLRCPTYQSILSYPPIQVTVLFLGHTSIFMKLQTQGYGIPCVQMWSQQETDCLCRSYFNASHEGALFKVICSV